MRLDLVARAMSRRFRRCGCFLDVWASGHSARASGNELPKATRTDRPRWLRGAASGLYAPQLTGTRPGCATRPRTTRTRLAYPQATHSSYMWIVSGVARAWKCACPGRFSWRVETPPCAAELARRCSRSRSRLPRGPLQHPPQARRTLARCTPPPPRFCGTIPSKTTTVGPPPRRATRSTAPGCLLVRDEQRRHMQLAQWHMNMAQRHSPPRVAGCRLVLPVRAPAFGDAGARRRRADAGLRGPAAAPAAHDFWRPRAEASAWRRRRSPEKASAPGAKPREPSSYNVFIREEIPRLKRKDPA